MIVRWCLLGAALLSGAPVSAKTQCPSQAIDRQLSISLRRFIAKQYYTPDYARDIPRYADILPPPLTDYALRFSAAPIPGTDMITAYVSGTPFCGSGGCTVLVLRKAGSSFRILGEVEMVFNPVMLLPSRRAGYPELGVWSRGYPDGGHEVAIRFDGRRYRLRETQPFSHDLRRMTGKVLIDGHDEGCPVL